MATQITSANTNTIAGSCRGVVRTSSGVLYALVLDLTSSVLEIWKSSDGSSWAQQNAGSSPSIPSSTYPFARTASISIDSSDVIWLAYYDPNGVWISQSFSSDTFGSTSTGTDAELGGAAVAQWSAKSVIDGADSLHGIWHDAAKDKGVYYDSLYYRNNVGGSWNTAVLVEGYTAAKKIGQADLTVDSGDFPIVVYVNTTDSALTAALGNANKATSFTLQDIASSVKTGANQTPSIAVDSNGDIWVAFIDSSDNLKIIQHQYGDSWSTWQTAVTIDSTNNWQNPSVAINGTDLYVIGECSDDNDIYYFADTGSGFGSRQLLETGTYQNPKFRWALWNNADSNGNLEDHAVYYFDASDEGPTDPDSNWTNESSSVDGDMFTTFATGYALGSETTNEIRSGGTTAPSSGFTIQNVMVRLSIWHTNNNCETTFKIYTNGESEALGTSPSFAPGVSGYQLFTPWLTLAVPSGGWNWAAVQALESIVWRSGGTSDIRLFGIELLVTSAKAAQSELDYVFGDGTDVYWNSIDLGGGPPVTAIAPPVGLQVI